MYAARRDHVERVIRPALERGAWVLCDRFADSTRAYQGAAGGVAPALIAALETHILEETRPDLTLIFDMPVDVGLQRAHERAGSEMRFESKGLAFHERLREGFLAIARAEPGRCAVVDARGTLDEVEAAVWAAIESRLAVHG
jgi:dTMP kinase